MNKEESVSNRLSRQKGTASTYNELLERSGPLNKSNKKYSRDIFELALALGYSNNTKVSLTKKDNFINEENFGKDLPALIHALAISKSDKGIEILADKPGEIYRFAEEYANGGLTYLNSEYTKNPNEFIETLRLKILKLNKDNKLLNELDKLDL